MNECLFCKLLNSPEFKQNLIYEDANFVAFPDLSQFTEGHVLVIPKKHYRWVWDVENVGQYFEACQKISAHLKQLLNIDQIYSLVMGSMVPHAHIHLIPKAEGRWDEILEKIGELQQSRITSEKQSLIAEKFKMM